MGVLAFSSLDPSVSCAVTRELRVFGFGRVRGEFHVLVPNYAYQVRRVDSTSLHPKHTSGPKKGEEMVIKPGSFILFNISEHAGWKCDPKKPETWLHTHHVDIFLACRAAEKIRADVQHNRLPAHAEFSTTARLLHAYAVHMRKDNPATISNVERRARQAIARCNVSSRHPLVVEARRRRSRAIEIKTDRLPSYLASLWSAAWVMDKRVAALTTMGTEFGRLHNALMAYNGTIAVRWAGHVNSLGQILGANEFATEARPQRLREIADCLEEIQAQPWVRVVRHAVKELRCAADLIEQGEEREAWSLADRAYRSMKIVLARFFLELQLAKASLGFTLRMSPSETELEMIAHVVEDQFDIMRSTHDTDFELRILPSVLPMLEALVAELRDTDIPPDARMQRLYHGLKVHFVAA